MKGNIVLVLVLCALLAGAFLICGCSTAKFKAHPDSTILEGTGSIVYSVDGVDFWRNGDPDRHYEILGVIEESHGHRLPFGRVFSGSSDSDEREEAIAKVARKNGGDAVVFVATPELADESSGHHKHQPFTLFVVKYVQ